MWAVRGLGPKSIKCIYQSKKLIELWVIQDGSVILLEVCPVTICFFPFRVVNLYTNELWG